MASCSIQLGDGVDYNSQKAFSHDILSWEKNFVAEEVKRHEVDSKITFNFHLKIAKSEFNKGKKVSGDVVSETQEQAHKFPLFSLFDKIQIQKKVHNQDPLKPDEDIHQKKLDFQIHTSDGYVIWCHSLVLVSENLKLATLMGSGLKESEQSTLQVKYGSDAMMEVLHVIYRGAISEKFHDLLYLDEILDAGHDYDLPVLKLASENQLIEQSQQFDGERCARILELGNRYGMAEVKRKALDWASENTVKVLDSEAGKELKQTLLREIHIASDAKHAEHKNKEEAEQEHW